MHPDDPPESPLYRYRFGAVEFDEARFELVVGGLVVELEQKPLQVLAELLRHVGEVVTREELFERVWAGRPTVDNVLPNAVAKLRKALGPAESDRIVTLPRLGYRLNGPAERTVSGRRRPGRLRLAGADTVPHRPDWRLERELAPSRAGGVWLARHVRSREPRVFKFATDAERLAMLKREATIHRVLVDGLGERDDIARILDWNFESPPFFIECEYGGDSLAAWAEAGHLATQDRDARLQLFLKIAGAVAAAHGVGVLHKDLKPANVLIAAGADGEWRIRLTDFGSSRLLNPERLSELGITRLGLTLTHASNADSSGTPLYLAPELIAGQPPTVASDVYSLGVILYQLVIGDLRRPLVPGWERGVTDALLCEDIARATDGDPALRLASVGELIARLRALAERHLEAARRTGMELEARRAREALQRSRARRPWLITALVVLGVGATCSSLLWWHSERQRGLAMQQIARAEAVVRFVDRALGAISTANSGRGNDTTIREMLEYASLHGRDDLPDDPEVRGDIHTLLGRSWRYLGDSARGVEEYRTAVRSYAQAFGESDERTLATRYALVRTLTYLQTPQAFAEAGALLDETDRLAAGRLRHDDGLALQAAVERGIFHLRRLDAEPALRALRRADELQRKSAPQDAGIAALIRGNIAEALQRSGRPEEALAWLDTVQSDPLMADSRIGEVSVALLQSARANSLHDVGRHAEALPLAQTAAATFRRFLGPDNYLTLTQLSAVAGIHQAMRECSAALPLAREVRERMVRAFGEDMQAALVAAGNLGLAERRCGDAEAGLVYVRLAESGLRLQFGADNAAAVAFGRRLLEEADAGVEGAADRRTVR